MDENRYTGTARNMAGRAESAVGGMVGNTNLQAEGRAREAEGTVENLVGQAKDAARQVADQASEVAGQVADRGREYLDQGRRYLDEGRQRYPEAERYYREGTAMVRGHITDSPVAAMLVAGAIGYLIALLIHRR